MRFLPENSEKYYTFVPQKYLVKFLNMLKISDMKNIIAILMRNFIEV